MEDKSLRNSFVSILNFVWRYSSEYRNKILFALILIMLQTLLRVLVPILTGKLVNSFTNSIPDWTIPAWICGSIAIVKIISYVSRFAGIILWTKAATKIITQIVTDAFDKVQHLSTEWHINNFAGSTVRNISRGSRGFASFIGVIFTSIFPSILTSIGLIAILFWNGFWIGIVGVFGFAIIVYISSNLSTNYLAPAFKQVNQVDTSINGIVSDAITCNSLVKSFAKEELESEKFNKLTEEWSVKYQNSSWRIQLFFAVQNGLFVILQVVIISIAIWLWFRGIRTAGDVITILTSFQLGQAQITTIIQNIRFLQQSINDVEEIVNLENIEPQIPEISTAFPLEISSATIVFKNVSFGYQTQSKPIYENISLTIAGGEKIALVGHSGSGKSTLIKLIQRLYDVQNGEITIDGQNVKNLTKKSLRRAIALVPQEPILFHRSIAENISYGKPQATPSEIEAAAKLAYAHEFITNLPKGYNTEVGERGFKLSGGERQRIAIARAILADCPILILDEATSNLDSVSESLIKKALDNLMNGRTTIIIAHRLSTIKAVDRILVFSQGKIVEEGAHEDLVADLDSLYHGLYTLQFKDDR